MHNISPTDRLMIAGYSYEKYEGELSDIIDVQQLPYEKSFVDIQWLPEDRNIRVSNIEVEIGVAQDAKVDILLNGNLAHSNITESGKYQMQLEDGTNEITVQADHMQLYDELTKVYIVDSRAPVLYIDNDYGASMSMKSSIMLSGRTEPGALVKINDEIVNIDPSGNFIKEMKLKLGDNPIKIVAVDNMGNTAQYSTTIKFYGNIDLILAGGFGLLYFITILIFFIAYKRKKKKIMALKPV